MDQLEVWRHYFSPENMLILSSEEFYTDPPAVVRQVLDFLGVPEWDGIDYRKRNIGKYPSLDVDVRQSLLDYFNPHNQRLFDFLGTEFDWGR